MGQLNGHARARRSSVRAPVTLDRSASNLRVASLSLTGLDADAPRELERLLEGVRENLAADTVLFGTPCQPSPQVSACVGRDAQRLRAWIESGAAEAREACSGGAHICLARERGAVALCLRLPAANGAEPVPALRLVISDGPRVLGFIVALRDNAFGSDEAELLETMVASFTAQLQREHAAQLAHSGRALVHALLESYAEPALLLSGAGLVELCNTPAEQWLDAEDRGPELEQLRAALDAGVPGSDAWVISSLDAFCPGFTLVRSRGTARNSPTQVVGLARQAWKLGDLQTQVLERVANGQSNKEIAKALKRAEVTIERHLTRLFRASGSHCRTELITRLFGLAP